MTPRLAARDLVVLSAVAWTGALLMAALAWAHMAALYAAYGRICGSGAGLARCSACTGAVALSLLGLWALALAARRQTLPAKP
jgi:hypothetical protein